MSLARTTALNGAATAVRLAAGLALNKLLAVYVGPAGFGVIGQFQSLTAMVGAAAGGIFGPGVTKLTAEHGRAPQVQAAAISPVECPVTAAGCTPSAASCSTNAAWIMTMHGNAMRTSARSPARISPWQNPWPRISELPPISWKIASNRSMHALKRGKRAYRACPIARCCAPWPPKAKMTRGGSPFASPVKTCAVSKKDPGWLASNTWR